MIMFECDEHKLRTEGDNIALMWICTVRVAIGQEVPHFDLEEVS